jgi:hypothetical protein
MSTELTDAEFEEPANRAEPPERVPLGGVLPRDDGRHRTTDRQAVNEGTFRHQDQEVLTDAATIAKTRTSGDSVTWVRKTDDGDVTPLTVGGLAMWGFEDVGPRVVLSEYDLLDSIG